jgi:hypothetical protein
MKTSIAVSAIMIAAICVPPPVTAQYQTAVSFLTVSSSPLGNGMGGVAATVPSSEASSVIANPGQLGLFSLDNLFSASTYTPRTDWIPNFLAGGPIATMTASAVSGGVNLTDILSLPFSAGIGVGYSRAAVDFGTFTHTGSQSPEPIGTFNSSETYVNYSVGLGLEYFARFGVGLNFKRITSALFPIGTGSELSSATATPSATDLGLLLDIPTVSIASSLSGSSLAIAEGIEPYLDISMSYVRANVGDKVVYIDPAQADPLPRTAVVGLGLTGGISAKAGNARWKMISFGLTRQAEDILVNRHPDGTFDYKSGLGDISIGQNVIGGKATANVLVRKGWEIGAAEFLYIRGGSVFGDYYDYSTSGYSICLGGLVRLIEFAVPGSAESVWVAYIGDHIDLQYHSATYTSPTSLLNGTNFKELNVVFRGFPW